MMPAKPPLMVASTSALRPEEGRKPLTEMASVRIAEVSFEERPKLPSTHPRFGPLELPVPNFSFLETDAVAKGDPVVFAHRKNSL